VRNTSIGPVFSVPNTTHVPVNPDLSETACAKMKMRAFKAYVGHRLKGMDTAEALNVMMKTMRMDEVFDNWDPTTMGDFQSIASRTSCSGA